MRRTTKVERRCLVPRCSALAGGSCSEVTSTGGTSDARCFSVRYPSVVRSPDHVGGVASHKRGSLDVGVPNHLI